MSFVDLHFYSEALGIETEVYVIIPQKYTNGQIGIKNNAKDEKYKCLYLLHGLSDDHTIWMRRTSIERYATEHGIAVVMPDGGRSFYTDMKYGAKYYSYIAKELPMMIEDMFNISDRREDRFIGGLSMGGYGAMKIALSEVGKYNAAFALSPVADIHNESFTETLKPVFGEEIPESDDLFALASAHNGDSLKPRIYMTTGTDDYMYSDVVRLDSHFNTLSYEYEYVKTPGIHSWDLWDMTVQRALNWMLDKK